MKFLWIFDRLKLKWLIFLRRFQNDLCEMELGMTFEEFQSYRKSYDSLEPESQEILKHLDAAIILLKLENDWNTSEVLTHIERWIGILNLPISHRKLP